MPKLSVIVPFFQAERGILSRALRSVALQRVPETWSVEVIVVDDGSPSPAEGEVRDLQLPEPLHLKVIQQANGGAGAARNRGLDEASTAATLIAFLDSDDSWVPSHLAHAIEAHERGFDFYFTDNRRPRFHSSHVHSACGPKTGRFIDASQQTSGILGIPTDYLVELILREFPTQASTVIYRRTIAPDLRFDTRFRAAGEDMLFFTALATRASCVGFDLDGYVECGGGVNIYFGNLSWDSPRYLTIKLDQLLAHRLIAETVTLSPSNREVNEECVADHRSELAFHILRNLGKHPARVPKVLAGLIWRDHGAALSLPVDLIHVARMVLIGPKKSKVAGIVTDDNFPVM